MPSTFFRKANTPPGFVLQICSALFIVLFSYVATSKFLDFQTFYFQMHYYPWLKAIGTGLAWGIPIIEYLIALLLIFPKTIKPGLVFSLLLMIAFTLYLILALSSHKNLPCSCGGVISKLSWKQHVWFNFILIGVAVTGLYAHSKEEKKST